MNTRLRILMTAIVILLGGSAHAQGTRDVSYTDRGIVSVQAKLRFTTLIILPEGERILARGCVFHNYFWFYRDAIEVALGTADWDAVERHASALEQFTHAEPVPWTSFFVARGRALSAYARGERDRATLQQLECLRAEADRAGFEMISLCNGSNSSRVKLSWLSEIGTSASRRAATMCARSSRVPLLPTTSFGSSSPTVAATVPSTSVMCARMRRRSPFESGSLSTNRAVSVPPRGSRSP